MREIAEVHHDQRRGARRERLRRSGATKRLSGSSFAKRREEKKKTKKKKNTNNNNKKNVRKRCCNTKQTVCGSGGPARRARRKRERRALSRPRLPSGACNWRPRSRPRRARTRALCCPRAARGAAWGACLALFGPDRKLRSEADDAATTDTCWRQCPKLISPLGARSPTCRARFHRSRQPAIIRKQRPSNLSPFLSLDSLS